MRFETLAVKYGEEATPNAPEAGDVVAPINLATTYAIEDLPEGRDWTELEPENNEYFYSRLTTPTRHSLEKRLASLHDAEFGWAFVTGIAAVSTTIMSCVEPGDHIVAFDQVYAGTEKMLDETYADRLDVDVTFVDARETAAVSDAMREETSLVWMETPTNPRMKLCDISAIADIAHRNDAVMGVDNTFMTPYFQRPLDLGADVVVDSTTKYLNGHLDSMGGSVVTNDEEIAENIDPIQESSMGNGMQPFDSYLVLRGLKTFPIRMDRHEANAMAIAEHLEAHDQVERVFYPGLESHPQHELAEEQTSGHGGMVSVELDATYDETIQFMKELDFWELAVSLGGVASLIEHPASMTHSTLSEEEREEVGITDSLLRLSVGIENGQDLIDDLDAACDAIQ
jgi:cystathionine gamma-lyase